VKALPATPLLFTAAAAGSILAGYWPVPVLVLVLVAYVVALGLHRPRFLVLSYVFLLASFPFATVPIRGLAVPLLSVLGLLALCVQSVVGGAQRDVRSRPFTSAALLAALLAAAALSAVVTGGVNGFADVVESAKWLGAVAGILAFALQRPSASAVATVGRVFLSGFIVAAAVSALSLSDAGAAVVDDVLSFLGYLRSGNDARFFVLAGENVAMRLTGPYTDPNILGLFSLAAIGLSFVGPKRVRWIVIGAALVMIFASLSRGAIVGLVVAVIVGILVHNRRLPALAATAGVGLGIVAAATVAPSLALRLAGTGSAEDLGSQDRLKAMWQFAETISGHLMFGLGWGRPEFRESAAAFRANVVANAPLGAVYRGGLIFAAVLVACMVVLCALVLRARRLEAAPLASLGAVGVGVIATLQTGYGGAVIPAVASVWLLLLVSIEGLYTSAALTRQSGLLDPQPRASTTATGNPAPPGN
jgi:hypothetical protein